MKPNPGNGGICFAHGPYEGQHCPHRNFEGWTDACVTDPRNPEYVAMAEERMRQAKIFFAETAAIREGE